jgi:predicted DNA-binding antitoxin AbrB/MazE fold protein
MSHAIRAIYEKGQLRLIDTIALHEGEEVLLTVHHNQDDVFRAILGDMLISSPYPSPSSSKDTDALLLKVQSLLADSSLSDSILEELKSGI